MLGIQSRSIWSPPPSLPKPATDSSLAEKPFLRPFLACGGLRFPVSARRHRLQAPSCAPVSGVENPVPNSTRQGGAGGVGTKYEGRRTRRGFARGRPAETSPLRLEAAILSYKPLIVIAGM